MTTQLCSAEVFTDRGQRRQCPHPVWDAERKCLFHSEQENKSKEFWTEIRGIIEATEPSDRVDFLRFVFPSDGFFITQFFSKAIDFSHATFRDTARFSHCEFQEPVVFQHVTFQKAAVFAETTFKKGANFVAAKFLDSASFERSKFHASADFRESTFSAEVKFDEAAFSPAESDRSEVTVNLKGAYFEAPSRVRFYRVNKTASQPLRIFLVNCDIRDVRFEDVKWNKKEGRIVLQDEVEASKTGQDHELVAIAYRRLVENFEKARSYDLSEDCFFGAMEMRRLDLSKSRSIRTASWFYRWISRYGSSYVTAGKALLNLLLVSSVFFLIFGFKADGQCVPSVGLLQWPSWSWLGSVLTDFVKAFAFSLSTLTFRRIEYFRPAGIGSQIVMAVATILLASQFALLVLALRRRFKK